MKVVQTGFDGLVELFPPIFDDNRGWFYEFYKDETFRDLGIKYEFRQENISFSRKGVIRGMHFQLPPHEQGKFVSVLQGRVLDVVVDIRPGSKTFGKTYSCELSSEAKNGLMVPPGFAHGFAALEDSLFFYKSTNLYNKEAEHGIRWDDPDLNIKWPINSPILSDKDRGLPTLNELLGKSLISRG